MTAVCALFDLSCLYATTQWLLVAALEVSVSVATANSQWYVLHVRPNYELSVTSQLRELGLEEYLPIKRPLSIPKRSRCSEGMPLFPGYVFSLLDLRAGPRLYSISGIIRILGHGVARRLSVTRK